MTEDTSREALADTAPYFAGLSKQLMSDQDVVATLDRICDRALEVVPAADFCAITVRRRRGRLETLAWTDEAALDCDRLQYALEEGPCISSAIEDEPFLVRSTGHDDRWPKWGPRVAEHGVHSLVSVQLSAETLDPDRDPLGAINLYARKVDAFAAEDVERALVFGVHAANALSMSHLVSGLAEAVESRHQIGVAQGLLMNRYGLDLDQAFEALQRFSSNSNVKLRDVARLVIEAGELPANYEDVSSQT
ncbi:GAF and ANTAR domain-containing protein [Nocardioides sp. JQ2195]|uniref:GAF and ANTAR domain-containing protein n=1 Tax=Nocardioides sp. JQ2195 TaxID=2592334 RepID=UPI00143E6EFC|nr:GAF and ANTAR domain-containing protein [Nocardioides sp. JQ2195]QIX27576.1 GAF and ANTAR domain-containing protein [Nocardioides sp. JQ2195]